MTGKVRYKEEFEFLQYDGDYDGLKNFCPGGTVVSKKGEDSVWILCGEHYNLTDLDKGDYVVKDEEGYVHVLTPERFKEKFEVIGDENKQEEEDVPISLSQCNDFNQLIRFLRKTDKIFEGCFCIEHLPTVIKVSKAMLYGSDCRCYKLKHLVFEMRENGYSAFQVKKGVREKITVDLFWEKGEAKHANNLIFIEEFNKKIDALKKMKESAEWISNTRLVKTIDNEIYGYEREIARKQVDSLVMEGRFEEADSLRKKYDIASGEY